MRSLSRIKTISSCLGLMVLSYSSIQAQGFTSGTATGTLSGQTTTTTFTTTNTAANSATSGYVGIGGNWTPTLNGSQARLQVFGGSQYALRQVTFNPDQWAAIELGRSSSANADDRPDLTLGAVGQATTFALKSKPGDVVLRSWSGRILFNTGNITNNVLSNGSLNTVMTLQGTSTAGTNGTIYGALVGIGNTSPVSDLDLSYDGGAVFEDHMSNPTSGAPNKLTLWRGNGMYYGIGTTTNTVNYFSGVNHNFYTQAASASDRILAGFISSQGMGINVSAIPAGYNLAVGGKIIAKELKITTSTIPDYVFSPGYQLKPLSEVDSYIKENGHLPEVPSATEVAANGINVSEMQATLLKKVEELTLYVIEQGKQLEQLKAKNAKLQKNRRHRTR